MISLRVPGLHPAFASASASAGRVFAVKRYRSLGSRQISNINIIDLTLRRCALRDTRKPIGVTGYKLTESLPKKLQGKLPTIKELEAELAEEKE